MHRNPVWIGFLILIGLCTLGYTIYTLSTVYNYHRLTGVESVQSAQWTIHPLGDDKYAPQAKYEFSYKGSAYQGETILSDDYDINTFAAKDKLEKFKKQEWKVWFDPSNPKYSSLQKKFPFKETVYAVALWFLLAYFVGLGRYVTRYK